MDVGSQSWPCGPYSRRARVIQLTVWLQVKHMGRWDAATEIPVLIHDGHGQSRQAVPLPMPSAFMNRIIAARAIYVPAEQGGRSKIRFLDAAPGLCSQAATLRCDNFVG